jgi:ribosome maturation factor RimP
MSGPLSDEVAVAETAARAGQPADPPLLSHPLLPELERLANLAAAPAGLAVQGVELLSHRIPMTLRVLVQRSDGSDVSLDECAALSGPLGEALEAGGLLESAYVLEVSSPGIGDELRSDRDFTTFRGFPVVVERCGAAATETSLEGLLLGREDGAVLLNQRGRTVRIRRDEVRRVRLASPSGSG